MEKTYEIILNNKATCEAIGELHSGHCRPVGDDRGNIFTSVTDAAKVADVTPQNMWKHLQPNGPRTCKGHVYFYLDKRDESFGRVMSRLSEVSAEAERRKADEEDARKWREYQAEQEAIRIAEAKRLEEERKAEEKRLADERKAKEKYDADVAKAIARIERRCKMLERAKQQVDDVNRRLMEAEKEYEALTGEVYNNRKEEDVA